jgi:hypothetical protein
MDPSSSSKDRGEGGAAPLLNPEWKTALEKVMHTSIMAKGDKDDDEMTHPPAMDDDDEYDDDDNGGRGPPCGIEDIDGYSAEGGGEGEDDEGGYEEEDEEEEDDEDGYDDEQEDEMDDGNPPPPPPRHGRKSSLHEGPAASTHPASSFRRPPPPSAYARSAAPAPSTSTHRGASRVDDTVPPLRAADARAEANQKRMEENLVLQREEKLELLGRLQHFMDDKGFKPFRVLGPDDALEDIRYEVFRAQREMSKKRNVKMMQKALVTVGAGIEMANSWYNPLKLRLDGFSKSLLLSIREYDDIFEELHWKYCDAVAMPPEMKLVMTLGSSIWFFHMSNVAHGSGGGNVSGNSRGHGGAGADHHPPHHHGHFQVPPPSSSASGREGFYRGPAAPPPPPPPPPAPRPPRPPSFSSSSAAADDSHSQSPPQRRMNGPRMTSVTAVPDISVFATGMNRGDGPPPPTMDMTSLLNGIGMVQTLMNSGATF